MPGLKVFSGSTWVSVGEPGAANFSNTATGTYSSDGKTYKYLRYTGSSTITITAPGFARVLAVGGGGFAQRGVGNSAGGGGGGGGYYEQDIYFTVGTYTVYVGGSGTASGILRGVAALAGGNGRQNTVGDAGGNGGGGGGWNNSFGGGVGLIGGNAGGTGFQGNYAGGGGGGGGAGATRWGGSGYLSSITGSNVYYGAGGAGAYANANGSGGGTGWTGAANTGDGCPGRWAGAAGFDPGSSGIVVVRVAV